MLYLKNEWMNWVDFLRADTNLAKLKVTLIIFGCIWSKIGLVFCSLWDSKICVSRMNLFSNWVDFLLIDTIQWKSKVTLIIFGQMTSKMGVLFYVVGLWSLLYLKNELMNWADFLLAGSDAKIFIRLLMLLSIFDF